MGNQRTALMHSFKIILQPKYCAKKRMHYQLALFTFSCARVWPPIKVVKG
jgi:hypothetical protein